MADEITVTFRFEASKGGVEMDSRSIRTVFDMTGVDIGGPVTQSVGTSHEALAAPADVAFPAHVAIQNLDATNYVEVFQDSSGTLQTNRLRPGDPPCFLVNTGAVPYVKANTAACLIQFWIVEQ
jgi:hypothetical protein